MSDLVGERTIAIVKATLPALEVHGLDIVHEMYRRLFENPEIRDLFNQSHHGNASSQPRALATAILAYAANIDQLGALAPAVERIAQKHVGLQIKPEHYPFVAEALLGAIKHVLGDLATDDILAAWGEAYWFLARILIAREGHIYREIADADGGWSGWRDFTVQRVTPESEFVTSFQLVPADGGPVLRHRPGQYLTFSFDIPGHASTKRNYSISSGPGSEGYRISVKREAEGLASRWLHGTVKAGTVLKVAPPAGEFYLPEHPERPVVLMSGGVGLTPLVSMLEVIAKRPDLSAHYIHGTHNGRTHAMRAHIEDLARLNPNIAVTTFYQDPNQDDVSGRDYHHHGLIEEAWLTESTPVGGADYYLCGPRAFLRRYVAALSLAGVPGARIHYEFFGPADELLAA